jgi:sortase (surface protein transpeptidase)
MEAMNKIKRRPHLKNWLIVLGCITVFIVGIAGYVLYVSSQKDDTTSPPKLAKSDITNVKKTTTERVSYDVPAHHPRNLIIEKIGIEANIQPMGLLENGALDAPKTAWEVGWYNKSALPGSNRNALLIDGHVNDALDSPGVFYNIGSLTPGDEMKIERGDHQVFSYKVVKVEQLPLEKVDMAGMLHSIIPEKEGLNLITCGGIYDYERQTYQDRILVYGERV